MSEPLEPLAEPMAHPAGPPPPLRVQAVLAPRPRRRVIPSEAPPRIVSYDGQEFEVVFDGVADRVIVESVA
jgi:hypothetical protein